MKLTITVDVDYKDVQSLRKNHFNLLDFAGEDISSAIIWACAGKGKDAPPYAGDVTDKADGSVSYTVQSKVTQ